MRSCWLNKQNNEKLIVFFAGWSFDENPFKFLDCGNYDVLFVYDYKCINEIDEFKYFKNYSSKTLIGWSMGVYAAYLSRGIFENFDLKIAVNGTIFPVDNGYGIPVKVFELTLKHCLKGLEGKFYQNVFQDEKELEMYLKTPVKRTIQDRVSELENLYDIIKNSSVKHKKFYDKAYVSEFDKIIPQQNQSASHSQNNVPVYTLPFGHFPFYNYKCWEELVYADQL